MLLLALSATSLSNSFQLNIRYIISRHFCFSLTPNSTHCFTFALLKEFLPSKSGLNLLAKNVSILNDPEALPSGVS